MVLRTGPAEWLTPNNLQICEIHPKSNTLTSRV